MRYKDPGCPTGNDRGLPLGNVDSEKISISFKPALARDVRDDADETTCGNVSAWLADAALSMSHGDAKHMNAISPRPAPALARNCVKRGGAAIAR